MSPGALRALCLLLSLLLPLQVISQGEFSLADALDDGKTPATPKPGAPAAPGGGAGGAGGAGGGLTLEDLVNLNDSVVVTKAPQPAPKVPAATRAPAKPKPKPAAGELDLADALDPNNDLDGRNGRRGQGVSGGFSDGDLSGVIEGGDYKPDKGKGGRPGADDKINQHDDNSETTAEIGTIAGIVSAVAMAMVGAISSYISYQKKKLCFSLQQSLNTDMVKAENPEAVVATEPQVQQTLLEPPNAEPPTEENAV